MNETLLAKSPAYQNAPFRDMANAVRALAMDAVEKAKSGHPGMPMGMADVATVLFTQFIKLDPADPAWPDRDRFVLSAGHGSMLQYALHHLVGYADMGIEQIKNFRQTGSTTPGHPEYGHTLGIETTTGPLGQGLATAVGMALAERMLAARYGDALVDHHTYVIAGDGCLMEGISHEAIDLAGHLKLGKLIVLWDDNHISIDGATDLSTSTDQIRRFEAAGWNVARIDGHDEKQIAAALGEAVEKTRQALADRLPHHHWLWRADAGWHVQGAWRAARTRGKCRRAEKPWMGLCAFRHPGRNQRRMAQGFHTRRRSACAVEKAAGGVRQGRAIQATDFWRRSAGNRRRLARPQAEASDGKAENRDAQGVGDRVGRDQWRE